MFGTTLMNVLLVTLAVLASPQRSHSTKPDPRVDRSYQLASIPIINGVQGVQYVPMAALYSEIPTVLVPKQMHQSVALVNTGAQAPAHLTAHPQISMDAMALQSTPASSVMLPAQGLVHQKYYETSTPMYPAGEEYRFVQEPVLQPVRNSAYHLRKTKIPVYAMKRPAYLNFGRKKFGAGSLYQNQKVSSISIEPSIDLSDQLQKLQGSFPSTTPAPASTYGPAKILDHPQNGLTHVTTYIRPKGHHPHPHYQPKDYRVFSHMHKGHIHNHHIPHGLSLHKSQYHSSVKPLYSVLKPTQASYTNAQSFHPEQSFNYHTYGKPETFSTNHIRYPDGELKKSLLNAYKAHHEEILSGGRFPQSLKTHSDLTQAIVKDQGRINNYDASIPIKIPSKKPNQFEVKEILRNADVHFIDGTVEYQPQQYVKYSPYHEFDPTKYQSLNQASQDNPFANGFSQTINNNHLDYFDQKDASSYSQVQTVQDELSTSETIKVPVAIIKGAPDQGSLPASPQRPELTKTKQKAFTPSRTTSDWIPMSGKPVVPPTTVFSSPPPASETANEASLDVNYGEKYFAGILGTRKESSGPTRIITSNRNIGDIISGKIPEEFSPFKQSGTRTFSSGSDIITGKIPFRQDSSDVDRRKGSVLDDNPSSSDTSNLVVSSMIKFS